MASSRVATAAIDFGTSGSSAMVALSASRNEGVPVRVALDGRSGDGSTGKAPTAVLLKFEAPHNFVAFGLDAFARYKDAKVKGESHKYLLFSEFKMELRPGATKYNRGDPNSFTVGASDRPEKYKLLIPVVETLRHAKSKALQQLQAMRGTKIDEAEVSWVLTVPAIWDDEARSFMRFAAEQAGIGSDLDPSSSDMSRRLALALEPEAAAIAAIPSIRKLGHRLAAGDRVMIVDAGGGTIDINVSEVIEIDEASSVFSLSELTMPAGGPFGGTAVDREFTRLLSSCARKKRIPASSWLGDTRREFLAAKESYDFSTDASEPAGGAPPRSYTVDITDVLEEWGYFGSRSAELEPWKARVIAAAAHSGKVSFSQRRGMVSISMDAGVMASFFSPVIDAIGSCIRTVAARRDAAGIKFVILAGGFASSKTLCRHVKSLFTGARDAPVVVLVDSPSSAIAEGAVRYGASPSAFIATRLVRSSFGFIITTAAKTGVHDFATQTTYESGTKAEIIHPLITKGTRATTERLSATAPGAIVASAWPVHDTQSSISFQFVRTVLDLPALSDTTRVAVPKDAPPGVTVPLTAAGLPQTVFVPRSSVVANLVVPMPPGLKTTADGECLVQFHFGRTEIEAEVTVKKTGDVRRCAIKYVNDRPTSVAGAAHAIGDDLEHGDGSDDEDESASSRSLQLQVLVAGLHPSATEHDIMLRLITEGAPGVRRIAVPRAPDGRSLARAVVTLHTAADAEAVVAALNGGMIRGVAMRATTAAAGGGGTGGVSASMGALRLGR